MKILADENMPYVEHLFADMGEVTLVNGRTLSAAQLKDVDILLIRSVTQVNQKLLQIADNLKFVGSATIGVDHLDLASLSKQNITVANAPGCNAAAVGEYAFMAMLELAQRTGEPLSSKKVGILGAGNTGTALANRLQACGIEVMLCDPFLQRTGDPRPFFSFPRLLAEANVISLHVPLTHEGPFPTWYLFDEDKLAALKKGTWLLNCCRGKVVDNKALINVKSKRPDLRLVLDVWEGEPNPLVDLVPLVDIATPHIAGYSLEGKARGTLMLYQALKKSLGEKPEKKLVQILPDYIYSHVKIRAVPDERALLRLCRLVYDLRDDDALFRRQFMLPDGFDAMRRNHRYRREFSVVKLVKHGVIEVDWLTKLGFSGVNL